MRKMFALYPDVLLINATQNTNNVNDNLFSIIVHDTYLKGQRVQVRNE